MCIPTQIQLKPVKTVEIEPESAVLAWDRGLAAPVALVVHPKRGRGLLVQGAGSERAGRPFELGFGPGLDVGKHPQVEVEEGFHRVKVALGLKDEKRP